MQQSGEWTCRPLSRLFGKQGTDIPKSQPCDGSTETHRVYTTPTFLRLQQIHLVTASSSSIFHTALLQPITFRHHLPSSFLQLMLHIALMGLPNLSTSTSTSSTFPAFPALLGTGQGEKGRRKKRTVAQFLAWSLVRSARHLCQTGKDCAGAWNLCWIWSEPQGFPPAPPLASPVPWSLVSPHSCSWWPSLSPCSQSCPRINYHC